MATTVSPREHHDLDAEAAQWRAWIDEVCADLGLPGDDVDVAAIHALSRVVAHGLARPLAPVSTFILGMAVGRGMDRTMAMDRIAAHVEPADGREGPSRERPNRVSDGLA